jgi:hypothetical protein
MKDANLALQHFLKLYHENLSDGNQRKGQAAFNALYQLDTLVADMIRGSQFDPFYRDERIPAFMQEVFGRTISL